MRIQNIQTQYKTPTFNSWNREVYKSNKNPMIQEIKHRNDTWLFRDGIFWHELVNFLKEKYKDIPKVNTYMYGCSNGTEAYTFLMQLLSQENSETSKKFLPIIAKDYDKVAIKKAKSYKCPLNFNEVCTAEVFTGESFFRFFSDYKLEENKNVDFTPLPILKDNVKFEQADILNDYKNIKPENSIVFVRNFWPYLETKVFTLAQNLGNHLSKNSFLVIGKYDIDALPWRGVHIGNVLSHYGFRQTDLSLVYEKK